MHTKYFLEYQIFLMLLLGNIILDIQVAETIKQLTKEDGLVENATAIFCFLASCLLFYLYLKSKNDDKLYFLKTKRNLFFLGLCLLCLFIAGEEISWGQRIFGISTPDYLVTSNFQKEINLHNLLIFQPKAKGIYRLFTSNAIAYEFFLLYCILIPLFHRYSKKVHSLIEKISLPVIPLWIGLLFLLNHLVCETIESIGFIGYYQIGEIKEGNFSVLFFIAFISFLSTTKRQFINVNSGTETNR